VGRHISSPWPPIYAAQWLFEHLTIVKAAGFEVVEVELHKAGTVERILARMPATG
jgi:hypothetical protein